MDLGALKIWFDRAAKEKGNPFWRVKTSSGARSKPVEWNYSVEDETESWNWLSSYIIGQYNGGKRKFIIEVISSAKDGSSRQWEYSEALPILGAAIGGAGRMTAQTTIAAAHSNEMKELREILKNQSVQIEKQNHTFELYQKDILHAAALEAEKTKTRAAEADAYAARAENKTGFERLIDHPAIAPKAGMAIGKIINSVFPEPQRLAVAGAATGESVPRQPTETTAAVGEHSTTETDDEDDGLNLSEDERMVLDAYDNLINAGITDAAERIYYSSMHGIENWDWVKPMQDTVIAEMKAKRGKS